MKSMIKLVLSVLVLTNCAGIYAGEQMSPEGKFAASVVVGGMIGVVGAEVLKTSSQVNGVLGVLIAMYGLYLLRESREDAVSQAVGPEYVGVSAISALGVGMIAYRR